MSRADDLQALADVRGRFRAAATWKDVSDLLAVVRAADALEAKLAALPPDTLAALRLNPAWSHYRGVRKAFEEGGR